MDLNQSKTFNIYKNSENLDGRIVAQYISNSSENNKMQYIKEVLDLQFESLFRVTAYYFDIKCKRWRFSKKD